MKKLWLRFWEYLLIRTKKKIDTRIEACEEIYVVYFNEFNKDVYICPSGKKALELVEILKQYHTATNKFFMHIFYGKASEVFKFKHLRVVDCVFTWNARDEEKRKIFESMADMPLAIQKGGK